MKPKVALTAASSFTGHWIARELHAQGYEVEGICSEFVGSYQGIRKHRVRLLQREIAMHFGVRAELGASSMVEWIEKNRPEIWIHHHHYMKDFRTETYDSVKAKAVAIQPLEGIISALKLNGCKGIIYSGTYFEPGEGAVDANAKPLPYAVSKAETWRTLSHLCRQARLPLSKIVIPNPVGPFEDPDRLIPVLISKAKLGEVMTIKTPQITIDNYPVRSLACDYAATVQNLLTGKSGETLRPSGHVSTVSKWVRTVNEELIERRLGMKPCQVSELPVNHPGGFKNREPREIQWNLFWDEYARELKAINSDAD